jgi:hypothetical protein
VYVCDEKKIRPIDPAAVPAIFGTAALLMVGGHPNSVHTQGRQDFDAIEVQVKPIQGSVYMLVGAGGNVTVQAGQDGVLLADSHLMILPPVFVAAILRMA